MIPTLCYGSLALFLALCMQVQSFSFRAEWMDLTKGGGGVVTPPRSGHVSFTTNGNNVHVFGGYVEEQPSDKGQPHTRYVTNDLWKWDNDKMGWFQQQQETTEVLPNPRLASACAVVHDTPTLFGGWDPQTPGTGGIILEDVCQLREKREWKQLDIKLPDGPASRHVAVAMDENRVVLVTHRCTNHVLVYQKEEFHKQPTTGTPPSPRGLHAATMLAENKLLITCGAAQDGSMANDVYVLGTKTWEWTRIDMEHSSQAPCPRASPCVCTVEDGVVVLFGGAKRTKEGGLEGCNDVWLLTMDDSCHTATWELLLESNEGPPGRNAATMNRIPPPPLVKDKSGHYFLLHGGWEPFQQTYNDNYVLRVYKE